jgi:hypothetical protein
VTDIEFKLDIWPTLPPCASRKMICFVWFYKIPFPLSLSPPFPPPAFVVPVQSSSNSNVHRSVACQSTNHGQQDKVKYDLQFSPNVSASFGSMTLSSLYNRWKNLILTECLCWANGAQMNSNTTDTRSMWKLTPT